MAGERQVVQAAHERGAAADKVKVSSYDPATEQALVGEATTARRSRRAAQERATRRRSSARPSCSSSDRVANTRRRGEQIAQSTLDQLASGSFEAEGTIEGNPAVKAGGKIKLEGSAASTASTPSRSVTQVYGHGDFRTRFVICGRHPRTLTDVMRPKEERDWGGGLVDRARHEHQGPGVARARPGQVPALGDTIESTWARVAMPAPGKDAASPSCP